MEILDIMSMSPILFIIIGIVLVATIILMIIIKRDRKNDAKEIEQLLEERSSEQESEIDNKVYKNQTDLENLLVKMQEDLEAKPDDVITHFENDQEEKSIISYQELVNTLKNEKGSYSEQNEMITKEVSTVEGQVGPIKTEIQTGLGEITKVEIPEIKEEKKFKGSDFISPIYGKQEVNIEYPKVPEIKRYNRIDEIVNKEEKIDRNVLIEENIELEPLREEIKRNDEFLQALKEFRKNL